MIETPDDSTPQFIELPAELVVRESSGAAKSARRPR
jgi:hypothetical protein